ncbi:MAG TPA: choice-of-anchor D domain-containing protein [Candidatus Sulfotelmatobacter sp.]|nr:choice-of-anchor D domain-containing protein [Candidatus Sulfotelmatobacter sp.]
MKNYARLAAWALACLVFGCVSVHAQNITTVVGGGPVGLTPTAASVGSPVAVRRDSAGNVYVLDNTFSRVLKIDITTGLISVYAGNGTTGFSGDGGPAINAQMNQPSGLCIDAHDNVFIADSDNAVIRVVIGPTAVTPSSLTGPVTAGNIYTAVGIQTSTNPEFGGDNGPALSSHLHFPDGCAFDTNGNLYIADRGNNEIRVVIGTAAAVPAGLTGPLVAGDIYRFAGAAGGSFPNPPAGGYAADGSAALGGAIYGPFDVFVDASNNVFFSDLGNNFGADGTPDTQVGQPPNNNVVREVLAANGHIQTVAGLVTMVAGVPTGQYVPAVASGPAVGTALNEPKGISVDASGNLYFCDTLNQVIRKVAAGNMTVVAGTLGQHGYTGDTHAATSATLTFPAGTFIDPSGNLYISDDGSNAVRIVPLLANDGSFLLNNIYTLAGNGHLSFGGDNATATAGELNTPAAVAVDPAGDIFVADSANDLIRKVSGSPAKLSTIAGQPEAGGFLNSPITLNAAIGVAADSSGNVYVADTANCLVRKISAGAVVTLAGLEPVVADPDNPNNTPQCGFGTAGAVAVGTKIGAVNSVAVDSHGNVFFSDKTNSVVWEVPAVSAGALVANKLYIVAGSTTAGFAGDGGVATSAQLSGPTGIYIDIYDNLFIADAGNHRIREVPAINVTTPTAMTAGDIYTIAGTGTSGNTGDGAAATGATLAVPFAIVVDNAENVFFSDTTNQTVREVAGSTAGGKTLGDIYTVAGTKNVAGFSGDGAVATSAQLNGPEGLALQPPTPTSTTANLLIGDSGNNRVRSVAAIANVAPVALVSFSPNPPVFAAEPLGTPSAPVAITLTNSGGAALTVTGFSISGADAGDFALGTNTCVAASPIAPSGTCTVNVVFTPTVLGSRTAAIVVAGTAFGSPQAALSGVGGTPLATLNPTTLTFASTTVNTAAATQTITLTNGGNAPTVIVAGGIAISGANAGDFSETDNCVSLTGVAAGANCTITVGFKPTAAGARTATLTVNSNVAPATATLNGTGAAATLSLSIKDTDASSTQTVTAGATATYNLSVSGNQSVTATITCTGAPTDATCSPTPASVAVTPTAAGTLKVSVTTTARGEMLPFNQPSTKMQPPTFLQLAPMASLALLFLIAMMFSWMQNPASRMRTLRVAMSLCLILMPIAAATMLVGCGGGGGSSTPPPPATGTPAGTYTLTVTATSGSTTAKTALTLVVN